MTDKDIAISFLILLSSLAYLGLPVLFIAMMIYGGRKYKEIEKENG